MACGADVLPSTSHLDHVVPISRGGGHDDANLQTLCIECSKAKTAREQGVGGGSKVYEARTGYPLSAFHFCAH